MLDLFVAVHDRCRALTQLKHHQIPQQLAAGRRKAQMPSTAYEKPLVRKRHVPSVIGFIYVCMLMISLEREMLHDRDVRGLGHRRCLPPIEIEIELCAPAHAPRAAVGARKRQARYGATATVGTSK